MDDLFSASTRERSFKNAPLAVRMRPNSLDEYVGQQKAVGKGSWLRAAIEHDVLSSVILYGPAGTGKTTLAHIIANHTKSEFVEVSAVTGTVKDLRRVIDEAKTRLNTYDRRTILFIDEIHRFSKSQQDALLHAVENRTVIMIGATTENPYFEVNSALLSRGRVVELEHLKDEDIAMLIERALEAPQGLNGKFSADEDTVKTICTLAAGDARSALTTLELASEIAVTRPDTEGTPAPAAGERYPITVDDVKIANPRRGFSYDKNGDMHYDIISAFIKSMRGSDPDATIYWLARMIDAGEDPKFIARRIMIQASEDVGNADPQALLVRVYVPLEAPGRELCLDPRAGLRDAPRRKGAGHPHRRLAHQHHGFPGGQGLFRKARPERCRRDRRSCQCRQFRIHGRGIQQSAQY